MKQVMRVLIFGSLVVGIATAGAADRRHERKSSEARARPAIVLASGPSLMVEADFGAPPPAPGIEGAVPPGSITSGPMPPSAGPVPGPGPMAMGSEPMPVAQGLPLFPCVKYRDVRNIAPCAVPMCVAVRDPCTPKHPCSCCEQAKCVMVQICVPPCGCPKILCKHDGAKVRYDYGKYAVNITSKNGVVVVNYDD